MAEAGAVLFLVARLLFATLYLANIPYIRTAVWLTGQSCLLLLAYVIVVQAIFTA